MPALPRPLRAGRAQLREPPLAQGPTRLGRSAADLRLVDLTNFLTIDRNRPVHVFDAGKVKGGIWLRLGEGGATFAALNGKEYELDDTMTGIGDESGVISLAGVMGGEPTGCTMETTDVFIEIALFDPVRTAATGRAFNLESDARYRFERGVDPAFAGPGMELMTVSSSRSAAAKRARSWSPVRNPRGGARSPFAPPGSRRSARRQRALRIPRHPHGSGFRL